MTALDMERLQEARVVLTDGTPLGLALNRFLDVAESYVRHGIRWGLVEQTAAEIVEAVLDGWKAKEKQ